MPDAKQTCPNGHIPPFKMMWHEHTTQCFPDDVDEKGQRTPRQPKVVRSQTGYMCTVCGELFTAVERKEGEE